MLDNGETRLAWVVCDLLGADRAMYEEAARLVLEGVKIPRANLMMSSTHTHSASSALGADRYGSPGRRSMTTSASSPGASRMPSGAR